ncbi:MAG: FAD-dependent oxidoreductase [Candidatus Methanofastidiosa archaeon]|nr:FAD-dependent oxidoreductase [Candidatus Methanofastidiosa archaeon]
MNKTAAVIGGGISGMQAALSLADRGIKVYLIERSSSIGGIMARLDKTMPTMDCSICILSPFMLAVARNPLIEVMTLAEVVGDERTAGGHTLTVRTHPRYVDLEKCTGCRECMAKCPKKVTLPYEGAYGTQKAIHFDFDQAIPAAPYIDASVCLKLTKGICGNCAKFCDKDAIDFDQVEEEATLSVGGVVIATGAEPYLPTDRPEYGYGVYKNVITAMELERLLSAAGPTGGTVLRASDKKEPKRVAFINCVGSRDHKTGKGYCSKVCCMYGIKEALLVKDHDKEADVTIFYIDIRASGKGYEEFYQNARSSLRFVRGRPGEVLECDNGDLIVRYEDTEAQEVREERFDLVVLNSALVPSKGSAELARIFDIPINEYGFFEADNDYADPLSPRQHGVYIIGACQGPNDITDSVSQSIGPVAKAYGLEGDIPVRTARELPGTDGGAPRVGVFVCHCGKNIGRYVDVPAVVEYARTLPDVVYAEESLFTCSEAGQSSIKEKIKELGLNRVVVAACSPKTHENTFQEALVEAGLNPYMLEMANIRNQCSWVHSEDMASATQKTKDLVRMSVAKARLLTPLYERQVPVRRAAVVIGGGVAGMTSALELARNGFGVTLVERSASLGGRASLASTIEGGPDPRRVARDLAKRVATEESIDILLSSEVTAVEGFVGDFTIGVTTPAGVRDVPCGSVIIATGFDYADPVSSGYRPGGMVMTEEELITALDEKSLAGGAYVFMLCMGVRNAEHPYCSRFCCISSLNHVRRVLTEVPGASVTVLYRDIRSYGYYEDIYKEVSELGARFIRYAPEEMPVLSDDAVTVRDQTSGEDILVPCDRVVLERGAVPPTGTTALRQLFKISAAPSGFYAETHLKLAPLDTALDGVFIAGGCQYPKSIPESVSQAISAAGRAAIVMGSGSYAVQPISASIDAAKCVACRQCEALCPYKALQMSEDGTHMEVITVSCKGCGTCAAFCPSNAITISGFTYNQEKQKLKAALEGAME